MPPLLLREPLLAAFSLLHAVSPTSLFEEECASEAAPTSTTISPKSPPHRAPQRRCARFPRSCSLRESRDRGVRRLVPEHPEDLASIVNRPRRPVRLSPTRHPLDQRTRPQAVGGGCRDTPPARSGRNKTLEIRSTPERLPLPSPSTCGCTPHGESPRKTGQLPPGSSV